MVIRRAVKEPRRAVVTFLQLDGACAAAQLLLKYPDADFYSSSANRIASTLEDLAKHSYGEVHICGLGIYCAISEVLDALNHLKSQNTRVIWYCGQDYLEEFRQELEKYCQCEFTGRNENISETLYRLLYSDKTYHAKALMIRFVGTKYAEPPKGNRQDHSYRVQADEFRLLIEGSLWRYFNYQDLNIYPHAVRVLAGLDNMTDSDRRIIEAYKRSGKIFLHGKSRQVAELREKIKKCGPTDCRVLITGETGTGKEVVARLIHESSPRAEHFFYALNCAILTGDLQQDALFGHVKGAFTGANSDQPGVFETANGGTLFLDEVGELNHDTQAKLLRVLQEGIYQRLGEQVDRKTDVRVIAATNRNLRECVRQGRFREDLFYRIAVIEIHIPPLRERSEDIPILASDILFRAYKSRGKTKPRNPAHLMEKLMRYPWPGNVRELENILERYLVFGTLDFGNDSFLTTQEELKHDKIIPLEQYEAEYVMQVYRLLDENITEAAKALEISRNTLKSKIRKGYLKNPTG